VSSPASSALTITIDTTPLNVTITKANAQADPTANSAIQFVATFSRPIDTNSFVCSDITVIKGTCTSVTLISGSTYSISITATSPGVTRAIMYA